jgi:hypothetical protein
VSYRNLRLIIESLLLEGVKDDLIELYPDHAQDIKLLQPKWFGWLNARFGKNPSKEETHPFADALETVKAFSMKDSAISAKYKTNEQFKTAVDEAFPPESRSWENPSDPSNMTVDEMETILSLSERKKQRFEVKTTAVENDRIGKVGPWNLWLPSSRDNSCYIAGYDPETMQPKTTWCTARMSGSNLFYSYASNPKLILFYVIKDDAIDYKDRLSIGFMNGKPVLEGKYGGLSVDATNKGLTDKILREILGSHYEGVMKVLEDKVKESKGVSPYGEKFAEAARSVEAFKGMTTGLSKDEQADLISQILKEKKISDEVYLYCAQNKHPKVVDNLMRSNAPAYVKKKVAESDDPVVMKRTVHSEFFPEENFRKLFNIAIKNPGEYWEALKEMSSNKNTPEDVLEKLADVDIDDTNRIQTKLARNPSVPHNILTKLFDRALNGKERINISIIAAIVANPGASSDILKKMFEIRSKFSSPEDMTVRIAGNPSTPEEILRKIMDGEEPRQNGKKRSLSASLALAGNPAIPNDILDTLVNEGNIHVLYAVVSNPATSESLLKKIISFGDDELTLRILHVAEKNLNLSNEVLHDFAKSTNDKLRKAAKQSIKARKLMRSGASQNEFRLREFIRMIL